MKGGHDRVPGDLLLSEVDEGAVGEGKYCTAGHMAKRPAVLGAFMRQFGKRRAYLILLASFLGL